jgi:hypothetical protein
MKLTKLHMLSLILVLPVLVASIPNADPIQGTGSAVFVNPQPTCPPAVCTGIGTESITWGSPGSDAGDQSSSLSFHGRAFTTPGSGVYEIFVIGDMDYFNGNIKGGTGIDSVDFCVEADITTPAPQKVSACRTITIVNTPNTSDDPRKNADSVTMETVVDFFVYEGESANATIEARFLGSPARATRSDEQVALELEIVGFGEVTGGSGFLKTSVYVPLIHAEP